ncbi:B3 domain-containing transcription factor VRN1-like isoform X2 [Tripterygium wilfordii]|uniref:B3 domain-containing transcription factor VRN1-like isoform X2 n=1 Tax=Tripterygium wilfordii TaxID=458696 RepID=UPI0018F8049E|nr:B3 domain-containing transcription factor VRN1-like isoform X2 [Tripterygium wilfordii]
MSSTRQRGKALSFSLKGPHFLKIILEDTMRAGKLGIPSNFVRKYGSSLPNVVFLRVPNGPDWRVELSRHNDNVWLHNGWREFAEHYSLDYGHLLVFEHKGCSQFYVMIFDKSAIEINYPYYGTIGGEVHEEHNLGGEGKELKQKKTVSDESVEISDDLTTNKSARASVDSLQPRKKMRNDSASQTKHSLMRVPLSRENDAQCNGPKPGISPCSRKEFGGAGSTSSRRIRSNAGIVDRTSSLSSKEKAKALERASAFQSKYPYFVMVMQPAYVPVRGKCRLAIPTPFSRKHLGAKQGNVTLCVSDERTWSAKYQFYRRRSSPIRALSFISNGWKGFVHDNNLKVGDVCAFELITTRDIKFKVFIFRAVEDPNLQHSQGDENRPNSDEPRRSLERSIVSDCTCKNESGLCGGLCALRDKDERLKKVFMLGPPLLLKKKT